MFPSDTFVQTPILFKKKHPPTLRFMKENKTYYITSKRHNSSHKCKVLTKDQDDGLLCHVAGATSFSNPAGISFKNKI